jgi:hypothetical protein
LHTKLLATLFLLLVELFKSLLLSAPKIKQLTRVSKHVRLQIRKI